MRGSGKLVIGTTKVGFGCSGLGSAVLVNVNLRDNELILVISSRAVLYCI